MRSTAAHTIRVNAPAIFSLDAQYFKPEFPRKDNDVLQHLMGYNSDTKKYAIFPPILFRDIHAPRNLRYAFRSNCLTQVFIFVHILYDLLTILYQILKVIFHGASSLSAIPRPKPKTNAQIWGVSSVTDGAISFAAIMASIFQYIHIYDRFSLNLTGALHPFSRQRIY